MSNEWVEAFVDKLVLLELKTSAKVHYRVMPPFNASHYDSLAMQAVARQIAEFIGLKGLTFIVTAAKQEEKVGGRIDLSSGGKEVFIEVDSETMEFPDAVSATLCQEVCHKWLDVHGIRSSTEIDNEILTDISCVFLGLGKIMLNGCGVTCVRHEFVPEGTRTISKKLTTGYLKRDQLAFVYRLVCAMRKIPSSEFMQGLNSEATIAIQRCDSAYADYYAPRFHQIDAAQDLVANFDNRVVEVQPRIAHNSS